MEKKEFITNIGEKIRFLRKNKGLSQVQLAVEIGCTRSYISHIETNQNLPGRVMCQTLADFFNVSIDWLMNYQNNDIITINKEEIELLKAFRTLPPEKAEMYYQLMLDAAKNEQFDK